MTLKAFQIRPDGNIPLKTSASTPDLVTDSLPRGFYTTFSTLAQGTRVLGLQAHLNRLYVPAKDLALHPAVDENILRERIAEIVQDDLPNESRVRLILAKDSGEIFVISQLFTPPPQSVYSEGVHVITSTVERSDPRIKGTDFIAKSADQRKLVGREIFEILLTHNGKILEGMTSNFYGVKYVIASRQGKQSPTARLITARTGILLGVTRRVVLRLARGQGMSIEYRPPLVGEKFDEAFLTSSSRGVVPIISIDQSPVGQSPVGQGRVGKWAKILLKEYQAYVQERSERIIK